ncbi:glycosyltransferase family 2 protein [Maricaulis sp.]|uniref:glycosyltransferase family 2 protein n=1 Tax=Maricaulis sp. TaxID=1486257 RepID=UPI0026090579|nr:glycosyltransferase family 2 protein [Maricaulis sp.]
MAPRNGSVGGDVGILSRREEEEVTDEPRLSVVTVSWQTGPHLLESVASILNAPGVDEFILVNHGNPPDMVRMLREMAAESDRFVLVESGGNLGFARGCNIGAQRASGDLVMFLNPDAVLRRGVVRQLKASASGMDASPWVIGARIVNQDGTEQRGGRRGELTPASALVSFLGLERFIPGLRSLHREGEPLGDDLTDVPVVSGAALMMPRTAFLECGGFDERYFLHVEDIDLCRQVRQAGGRVCFEPRATILHYGGTSQSSPFFVETHKALGFVKYFWKYYPGPLQRLTTMLMIGPIFAAIWARVILQRCRNTVRNSLQRTRARMRLSRIRKQAGR